MRKIAHLTTLAAAAALVICGSAGALAQSASQARPKVSFSFVHADIRAGTKPEVAYRTAHLPRRSVIVVQRQFGTSRSWRNVATLKALDGTATLPKVPLGKYSYRIVVRRSGITIATSGKHYLYAFGTVPFAAICSFDIQGTCAPFTRQIGNNIYTFVFAAFAYSYPTYEISVKNGNTSCNHITLDFADSYTYPGGGGTAYLEVVQSKSDPVYAQTAEGTLGHLSAKLDGGPFYIDASETYGDDVYTNGSATCYTRNGQR